MSSLFRVRKVPEFDKHTELFAGSGRYRRRSLTANKSVQARLIQTCRRPSADSPPAPPSIPVDLLHEILARTNDTATVVRCAATSRAIRCAVLDDLDFLRRRLALGAEASSHGGSFDPALLLGFTFVFREEAYGADDRRPSYMTSPVVSRGSNEPRHSLRFDAGILDTFGPVASRGGLVVLRPRGRGGYSTHQGQAQLRVCNSLTGHTVCLPAATVREEYPHALLNVDDAGRSSPTDGCERKPSRRRTVSGAPSPETASRRSCNASL
ncbi:hypothetical protein BAE44_0012755 [Dichanthelium oligosanthes]|uniref:DUF7595 domain-containing protein n=1 Tax=Dichanthelium oligosanthes TaxID=888268 RepID=A0A1E5VM65_9POAL|nr:hypothetical protein BAE44_0012755 [Dichanthelium oligosanthes]